MARCSAIGDVAKRVPQDSQFQHLPLDFVGLGMQFGSRKVEGVVPPEHSGDLRERKPGPPP